MLRLKWDVEHPARLVNLESIARQKRFQALGRACRDADITSLLLAHHGDDQAETVLSRLVNGYGGSGLRGIKAEGNIPECHGLYGVAESGWPYELRPTQLGTASSPMQIESGGVRIYRPLLDLPKSSLVTTCLRNGVSWFEDATNADKSLTIRNTVRHLLREKRLPAALSTKALRQMAANVEKRVDAREDAAETIFNSCKIELDMWSGSLTVQYPSNIEEMLLGGVEASSAGLSEAKHLAALVIRRLLMLVSYKSSIELQTLGLAVHYSFPFLAGHPTKDRMSETSPVNVASVIITKTFATGKNADDPISQSPDLTESSTLLEEPVRPDFLPAIFQYQVHQSSMKTSTNLTVLPPNKTRDRSITPAWTNWRLFKGRYWIRIRYRPFNLTPAHSINLRLLKKEDITNVRNRGSSCDSDALKELLSQTAPGKRRYTMPVIVESYQATSKSGKVEMIDNVCTLPTIDWGTLGWGAGRQDEDMNSAWEWECRYRAIDFGKGTAHSIKRIDLPRKKVVQE